jgi:predicted glutamine amidotransferase
MFAVHSSSPVLVTRAFDKLRQQACEHKDGWGIAQFDQSGPTVETALNSAQDCSRFSELGNRLFISNLMVHLRLASVGRIEKVNAHPFAQRGFAFMHNGTVHRFAEFRHLLLQEVAPHWRSRIAGETDSELCFAVFLSQLDAIETPNINDLMAALGKTINIVLRVFDAQPPRPDVQAPAPSALNFVVGDGRRLVASRLNRTLYFCQEGPARYLASEPLWPGEAWSPLNDFDLLAIDGDSSVHRQRFSKFSD